jgi:hypothetical protein
MTSNRAAGRRGEPGLAAAGFSNRRSSDVELNLAACAEFIGFVARSVSHLQIRDHQQAQGRGPGKIVGTAGPCGRGDVKQVPTKLRAYSSSQRKNGTKSAAS